MKLSWEDITRKIINFRDERDWEQFHNSKDLALALLIEASELNELFLWKDQKESDEVSLNRVEEELADILIYAVLMAEKNNLKIDEIILKKLEQNRLKYPIEKAKGKNLKYTEL